MTFRRLLRFLLGASLLLGSAQASAQSAECAGWDPTRDQLIQSVVNDGKRLGLEDLQDPLGCLGDFVKDPSPLTGAVRDRFKTLSEAKDFATEWPLRKAAAREAAILVRDGLRGDSRAGVIAKDLDARLVELIALLSGPLESSGGVDDAVERAIDQDSWRYRADLDTSRSDFWPYSAKLRWKNYPSPPPDEVARGAAADQYLDGLVSLRAANLMHTVLRQTTQNLRETLRELERLSSQWETYFERTRSQYLPELLLNSSRVTRNCPIDERRNRGIGWCEVPTDQIIFLHPDVILEYAEDAPDGEQLVGAIDVEVIGFNRWSWSKEEGHEGETRHAFGASAIVTYSDRAGFEDLGYGVLLHFSHKYSIGATYREEGWGVVASADLARLWTKVSEKAQSLMKSAQSIR